SFGPGLFLRQGQEERRAGTELALEPDFTAVRLHDVFDNGKTQAGAARLAGAGAIDTIKTLENAVARVGRNAGAVIAHPHLDLAVGAVLAAHDHPPIVPPV